MAIHEIGIIFRGNPIIFSNNHLIQQKEIDINSRTDILTGVYKFIEATYSEPLTDYVENSDLIVAFTKERMKRANSNDSEIIIGYAILDRKKKLDKYISKHIIPSLEETLKKFVEENEGKDLSNASNIEMFKTNLDEIFKKSA